MNSKLNTFFVISLILFSLIPVQAAPPTKYYEIDSDVELRGAIFVNVDPTGFYASFNNGIISINSIIHHTDVEIKFKGIALNSKLKKYNGFNVGYTHIDDNGKQTNIVKTLVIDNQGFAYLTTDFSTVIINGMTGITTSTYTNQNGNQSFNVPYGISYDINITNNHFWGDDYGNNKYIEYTTNSSMILGSNNDMPLQLFVNLENLTRGFAIYYTNGTEIPKENESYTNNNLSVFYKPDITDNVTDVTYQLWYGNESRDEPSDESEYGSHAVWDNFAGVWLMNNDPSISNLIDSTSNNNDGVMYGSMTSGDLLDNYGKEIDFDGNDYFSIPDTASLDLTEGVTMEMVLTSRDNVAAHRPIVKGNYAYGTDIQDSYIRVLIGNAGGSGWNLVTQSDNTISENERYVITTSYSSGTTNIYVNGIKDGSGSGINENIGTNDINVGIGATINPIGNYFDGLINIIRLSNIDRSHEYTVTSANNILNPTSTGTGAFYKSIGNVQTISDTVNITASIAGDNNTQSYNTSQSIEFTLIPVSQNDYVNITTYSTDYDITIITYWSEDTTQYSQTDALGYVKSYINYTPSFDITTATFNDTINSGVHNFSNDDYIGIINTTINNSYISAIRNGQEINATAYNLIDGVDYLINFTIPYNNIFTLSNQTDHIAFLGVLESFTDSAYNDPDSNPIASRFWEFGDGTNSSSSNPSHTYTSLGNVMANYTVTEDATTNSQTITKEFNVSVLVQPVQNLITDALDQTWIKFNWSDYSIADYWNVSIIQNCIPKSNESFILDGVKDSGYDATAHAYILDTPNPVSNLNYETIYWTRNNTHILGYADGYDNDVLPNDDSFFVAIDGSNDNLTADDRKFILSESGTVTAQRWSGSAWLPQATNAEGFVVGAGVEGAIQYEMIIPVSEVNGFVDNATIKFAMGRTDSALNPDVESFFPTNLINDTDATLWSSVELLDNPMWDVIGSPTASEYNSTGLTPYTWYKHRFVTINGSTESTPVYSTDITEDVQHYSVSGYIKDTLGNVIPGATVHSENGIVGEITQSDINGYYIGYNFKAGNYSIYGNKSGYSDNFTDVYVTGNVTNLNVTLTAFEMTDWMLWEKLLEIEELLTVEESAPTEITKMTYQIFILLIIIDLLAVWYSFTHTDKSYYTDILTSLLSVIISAIIAYNSIIGVSYYFATQSTVHEIEYTSVSLAILFASTAGVMLIFFIAKILELNHKELDEL